MTRSGWLTFSAVVLIIAGIMRVIDAIWAFGYHGAVPDGLQGALLGHSLATYGWVWLITGIILIAAAHWSWAPVTGLAPKCPAGSASSLPGWVPSRRSS